MKRSNLLQVFISAFILISLAQIISWYLFGNEKLIQALPDMVEKSCWEAHQYGIRSGVDIKLEDLPETTIRIPKSASIYITDDLLVEFQERLKKYNKRVVSAEYPDSTIVHPLSSNRLYFTIQQSTPLIAQVYTAYGAFCWHHRYLFFLWRWFHLTTEMAWIS
jgi:hypothetical protein